MLIFFLDIGYFYFVLEIFLFVSFRNGICLLWFV